MSSNNAGSRLYGDEDPFPIVNSDEEESTMVVAGTKKKMKRLMKISEREKKKKADVLFLKSTAQEENTMPPEMEKTSAPLTAERAATPQIEVNPSTNVPIVDKGKGPLEEEATIMPSKGGPTVAFHTFGDPPTIKCPLLKEFVAQLTATDSVRLVSGMAAAIEEVNLAATEYSAHRVAVAGLRGLAEIDPSRPNVKLPLWEALCDALVKMGSPEDMAVFPGDPAVVLSKGPRDEEPIPEVSDEYIGIELEEEDDEASGKDVSDAGNSGQKNTGEVSLSHPKDGSAGQDADSWSVHRIHLMILSEEQSREYPLYSMISEIMRSHADVHSIETVLNLEADLLDAMRVRNVKVNQHLIKEIKELRAEIQRRDCQKDKDFSDSLTFETDIHDELVALEKENARLKQGKQITVLPWFLEKHKVLARVQHMISIRMRRFILAMDMLKERTCEAKLLMKYISKLQNLLLDHSVDFLPFEKLEELTDPRTRSS
ncbi:OLC1v1008460C1 [Oldenlandia corymbosa var. corymbosa]|uniref:OLC1v1008460C1 n=1 Tax=Oldenlandia corymbosa var. corymbosa TaxID=529605 RepID=A0AAV1DLQ6_OLDCO|nr:OLC1v1008460C1 [Oldenlandia corymbosa var. corymbosa]